VHNLFALPVKDNFAVVSARAGVVIPAITAAVTGVNSCGLVLYGWVRYRVLEQVNGGSVSPCARSNTA
jgi:hypothetical protein